MRNDEYIDYLQGIVNATQAALDTELARPEWEQDYVRVQRLSRDLSEFTGKLNDAINDEEDTIIAVAMQHDLDREQTRLEAMGDPEADTAPSPAKENNWMW